MKTNRRYWLKIIGKMVWLYLTESIIKDLIKKSYDEISNGYDEVWTNHMRDKSIEMINKLDIKNGSRILDLACGTGFITTKLAEISKTKVTGVDLSEGMLKVAQRKHGKMCDFIKSDVIDFLTFQPDNSYDIITCAWGLGYSRPYKLIKQSNRVLKKGGTLAIIDNSLFSIKEAVWSSIISIAEKPNSLEHMFNVHFLPTLKSLELRMKISNYKIKYSWKGSKTYWVKNGKEAINRLISTGAFAGLQFCYREKDQNELEKIFIKNIENKYKTKNGIPIKHRYIGCIGCKKENLFF